MIAATLVPVTIHPCSLVAPFDAIQSADLTKWDGLPDDPEVQKILLKLGLLIGKKNLARNAPARGRPEGSNEVLN